MTIRGHSVLSSSVRRAVRSTNEGMIRCSCSACRPSPSGPRPSSAGMPRPAAIDASEPPPVRPDFRTIPSPPAIPWARANSFSEALVFSNGAVEDRGRLAEEAQDPLAVRGLPEPDIQRGRRAFGDDVGLLAAADEADVDRRLAGPQPLEPDDLGDELLDGADPLLGRAAADVEADDEPAFALELQGPAGERRLEAKHERGPAGQLADELGRGRAPGLL